MVAYHRGTQRQFLENICSEDDLRYRIFGTFVFKFLACPPLQRFSNLFINCVPDIWSLKSNIKFSISFLF